MPRVAVFHTFEEILGQSVTNKILQATDNEVSNAIKETAKQFDVNYTAMKYRLQTLGLLEKESQKEEYIV